MRKFVHSFCNVNLPIITLPLNYAHVLRQDFLDALYTGKARDQIPDSYIHTLQFNGVAKAYKK